MEELIKEHEKKGGFDKLPGKGKPIDAKYLKGDVFTGIIKHNHVLPPWLELQHEIRDAIRGLFTQMERKEDVDLPNEIRTINQKILHYNKIVPRSILRKSVLRTDNISECLKEWE
ncbi:DUF1992 domain-containing protein [Paludifilum halophilum]|uniref:DnaJ family domain-containing protein n=1 Tax=Paludifilum halophilum TaxID=1642702 RepID=UPI00146BE375|nr:DUF1992 domain-containing protein [Paludifilum halophilum]